LTPPCYVDEEFQNEMNKSIQKNIAEQKKKIPASVSKVVGSNTDSVIGK